MSIRSVVLIKTNSLNQSYVDALSCKKIFVRLVDPEYFISHTNEFSSTNLVVIETLYHAVLPILKINKKNIVPTLLILDDDFLHTKIKDDDIGALTYLPFELSPSNLVKYISILDQNRKSIVAGDGVLLEKNRLINIAVGILMTSNRYSSEDAYKELRITSRKNRSKIETVSLEIIKSQKCLNEFSCDYIETFNDRKNCKPDGISCPYHLNEHSIQNNTEQ